MDNLILEMTHRTPKVDFNVKTGEFLISGSSIPEDCLLFYKDIFNWLDDYLEKKKKKTILELRMKFFNTSTSKCLFTIFRKMEDLKNKGKEVIISWYYELEDTDMYESGVDFQQMIKVPFKIDKA